MRVSILAAAVVFVAAALGALLVQLGPQAEMDDDRIYLYATNFTISEPKAYQAESDYWRGRLSEAGYHSDTLARYNFRDEYATNYVAQAAVMAGLRAAWTWEESGLRHPDWLRSIFVGSGLILLASGLGVAFWMLARLPPDQRGMGLVGFVGLAVLCFLPALVFNRITVNMDLLYPVRALYVMAQPGFGLTPIGIQNRNIATLLVIAAVFARWRGATPAVYWIAFAAATLHATYGALILLMMLGLDVALRPDSLRRPSVLMPVAATAGWSAFLGLGFEEFTAPVLAPLLFFGAVATMLVAAFLPLDRLSPIRRLRALPPRWGEAVVLLAALLIQLAVVAVAALQTEGLQRDYVVGSLSGRPLGLLRVPLFLTAAAIIMAALPPRLSRYAMIGAGLVAVASIPVGLVFLKMRYEPAPTAAEILAAVPAGPANGALASSETERAVYYSIARSIDLPGPQP